MPRVKRGTKRNDRRKKILKRASGYFLTKSKLYQAAQEAVERGMKFAYIGRKQKKRQFRSLWIARINAAAKLNGTTYSLFIHGLKMAGVELDRKVLAEIAVADPAGFTALANQAKAALANAPAAATETAASVLPATVRRGSGRAGPFLVSRDRSQVPYRENTTPCGRPDPFQPCGQTWSAKLKPGFPSASWNAVSIESRPSPGPALTSKGVAPRPHGQTCVFASQLVQCKNKYR